MTGSGECDKITPVMEMDQPKRKHPRLKEYDYSQNGSYFATICVKDRRTILGAIDRRAADCAVGRDDPIPPAESAPGIRIAGGEEVPAISLSRVGAICDRYIRGIDSAYPGVHVDSYVIMPNHVHLLLCFDGGGMGSSRPTLPMVIRAFKRMTTREIGHPIWQDSFYEHTLRCNEDLDGVRRYILENPARWDSDEYFA